jgi:cyclophilin family peptidyl-prolyl cis-trans isomerase
MFKEENQIFLYLVGILVFFGIFIVVGQNLNVTKILSLGRIFNNPDDLFDSAPTHALEIDKNYIAIFNTSKGSFTVNLYEDSAPNNVNNFVYLSNNKYYEGTKFHRLVPHVLVQGGDRNTLDTDPDNDGRGRAGYVLNDEINLSLLPLSQEQKDTLVRDGLKENATVVTPPSKQYMLFMANDGFDTVSTQFFITLADSSNNIHSYFNGKFTPIGEVTEGAGTLSSINSVPVDDPTSDFAKPTENIVLQNIVIQTL